jgi:head-tail adaptor
MGAFGSASSFPTVNPGDFRHWITFLRQQSVVSISGTKVTWVADSPPQGAWAKIEAIRGADLIREGQDATILYLTVSMWFQPGITSNMHIITPSGAECVVLSVENVLSLNHILILNCQAIGAQAEQGG